MAENLSELKAKQKQYADQFNSINNDPSFQSLRVRTQEAFRKWRETPDGPEREQLYSQWSELNTQYAVPYKQLQQAKTQLENTTQQIERLASVNTGSNETTPEQPETKSPQPPQKESDVPEPQPAPSATNSEVTNSSGVVGYRTTDEEYRTIFNESRKKYGLEEVSANDPRLIEYISERRADTNSAGYTPPTSEPETTESYTKTADEPESAGVSEPEITSGYRDEFDYVSGSAVGRDEPSSDDTSYYSEPENERDVYNDEGILQVNISGVGSRGEGTGLAFGEEFEDIGFGSEERTIPNIPAREQFTAKPAPDLRFRISLAPSASYLYKDSSPGILAPLARTGGVIYPYTPQITVVYAANYNSTDITHSNYKIQSYRSSSVESVSITGDFTAQDSTEANYLLAVIHFFKSVTKMFYGQDNNPARGVPPPLCYLTGFGQYQFDHHPVVINNFTYTMPVDVDYVNAYPTNPSTSIGGVDLSPYNILSGNKLSPLDRLRRLAGKIDVGGTLPAPKFNSSQNINEITRVPSKISLTIQCLPVVTRNTISNQFSLKSYATGALMRGSSNPKTGGGVW